jgi:hypothetical protein
VKFHGSERREFDEHKAPSPTDAVDEIFGFITPALAVAKSWTCCRSATTSAAAHLIAHSRT